MQLQWETVYMTEYFLTLWLLFRIDRRFIIGIFGDGLFLNYSTRE